MTKLLLKLRMRRDEKVIKRLVTQGLNNNLDIIAAIIIRTLSLLKSRDLNTVDYIEGIFKYIPSRSIEVENFKINLLKLVIF